MVNKPAALYLEDARRARRYTFNDVTPTIMAMLATPVLPSPALTTPRLGSLRPLTLVSATTPSLATRAFLRSRPEDLLASLIHSRQRDTPAESSRTREPHVPEVMYGRLDTGYFFECHISHHETGSYISADLLNQISPLPDMIPASSARTLRYNDEMYPVLGYVQFQIEMASPDDPTKQISMQVTATVIPNIYPDLFLGRDQPLRNTVRQHS